MYTIKDVSKTLGLPPSTIRYYDRQGLLPQVRRSEAGYRVFSDDDIQLLKVIECLKRTQMPIRQIRLYCQWAAQGDGTLEQRYRLFQERRQAVLDQMEQLRQTLALIEYKCGYYEEALAGRSSSSSPSSPRSAKAGDR